MKKPLLLFWIYLMISPIAIFGQEVRIDGELKPYLDDFFAMCKSYDIEYNTKLLALDQIAVVDSLRTSPNGSTLGMLQRDENGKVENIVVNWIAMLDKEILKVVAFHEFGHYFLEYEEHVCRDCGTIMSAVNSSYFDIANDWDNQIKILFEQSPAYIKKQNALVSNAHSAN